MNNRGAEAPPPKAGDLPFPGIAPGTPNKELPFDHLVVVLMENHSFDNLLGALRLTRPDVDGLRFDESAHATDSNPGAGATSPVVRSFPFASTAQAKHVSQSWKATHEQIDGGAMDGFVRSVKAAEPMGYYTPDILPFAYSFASTFAIANRWFCSVPGPTYPNRRFLLAGTAYGATVTSLANSLLEGPPPNGTIMDQLSAHNVSWANYFTDIPMTSVIPASAIKHLDHLHPISKFHHDCLAGTLPSVSFVDPAVGAFSSIARAFEDLPQLVKDALRLIGAKPPEIPPGETEEDPQCMYYGELWAYETVEAVLRSPAWERTLLIYTYDEHGGYYDHVPPPAAIPPDDIVPTLAPDDPHGGYDIYGPRVPAIIASPYAKSGTTINTVYDHTSILATMEEKWNLPALTDRDANANSVGAALDAAAAPQLDPPKLAAPSQGGPSGPG